MCSVWCGHSSSWSLPSAFFILCCAPANRETQIRNCWDESKRRTTKPSDIPTRAYRCPLPILLTPVFLLIFEVAIATKEQKNGQCFLNDCGFVEEVKRGYVINPFEARERTRPRRPFTMIKTKKRRSVRTYTHARPLREECFTTMMLMMMVMMICGRTGPNNLRTHKHTLSFTLFQSVPFFFALYLLVNIHGWYIHTSSLALRCLHRKCDAMRCRLFIHSFILGLFGACRCWQKVHIEQESQIGGILLPVGRCQPGYLVRDHRTKQLCGGKAAAGAGAATTMTVAVQRRRKKKARRGQGIDTTDTSTTSSEQEDSDQGQARPE